MGNFVNIGGMSLNGYERNNLFRNEDGKRFVDVGYLEAVDRIEDGRGVVALDFDVDGDLDLVVENYLQPVRLLVNNTASKDRPSNHWLELKLVGRGPGGGSNRSAVGARATVRSGGKSCAREVVTAGGYLSGFSKILHFGVGGASLIDEVEIRWPSGRKQVLRDIAIDRRHTIQEPEAPPIAATTH